MIQGQAFNTLTYARCTFVHYRSEQNVMDVTVKIWEAPHNQILDKERNLQDSRNIGIKIVKLQELQELQVIWGRKRPRMFKEKANVQEKYSNMDSSL